MKGKYYYRIFCALLMAVSCCFFAASFNPANGEALPPINPGVAALETPENEVPASVSESGPSFGPAFVLNMDGEEELILASYRNQALRDEVLAFFGGITGSEDVADLILFYSSIHNIPPALAFSLCAEESAYNPQAYNRNQNETVDRGLFQLNSASFPKLSVDDFYDPAKNVRYGLSHLRWCFDTAGTEVAALAMYNAGEARVSSTGTPRKTLDYISRILRRQRKIEGLFMAEYLRFAQQGNMETVSSERAGEMPFRLNLLTPLGGHRKL